MSDIHDLHDDLPPGDYERIGDALRSDLRASAVPHDDARADAMIRVATEARAGRFGRWVAPVGTAAAILAVGAGVAVFAATAGTDNAAPPAGGSVARHHHPRPTSAVGPTPSVLCISWAHAHPPVAAISSMPAVTEVAPGRPSGPVRLTLPPVRSAVAPPTPTEMPAHGRVTCADGRGRSVRGSIGCAVERPMPTRIGVLPRSRPRAVACPPVGHGVLGRVNGGPASTTVVGPSAPGSTSPGRVYGSESPPKPAAAATCSASADGTVQTCAMASAPPSQTK